MKIANYDTDLTDAQWAYLKPMLPNRLWIDSSKTESGSFRPDYYQVISPYIHEEFGTEEANLRLQKEARGESLNRVGAIPGITLFDKVIQTRNRGASDPIDAYKFKTKKNESCELFNGEPGCVLPPLRQIKNPPNRPNPNPPKGDPQILKRTH
jgi:hypothetical protein